MWYPPGHRPWSKPTTWQGHELAPWMVLTDTDETVEFEIALAWVSRRVTLRHTPNVGG